MAAKKSFIELAEDILSPKLNQLFGLNTTSILYNADGTVHTVTDSVTGVVYTFSYNTDGSLNTVTDGDNTWTMGYTGENLTSVTKT